MTVGTDITIHCWYDEAQDVIKLRIAGELTTVNNKPGSKRGNASLYRKLAVVLREEGKKFPTGVI